MPKGRIRCYRCKFRKFRERDVRQCTRCAGTICNSSMRWPSTDRCRPRRGRWREPRHRLAPHRSNRAAQRRRSLRPTQDGCRLRPEGRDLLASLRSMERAAEQIERGLAMSGKGVVGSFRLGTTDAIASLPAPELSGGPQPDASAGANRGRRLQRSDRHGAARRGNRLRPPIACRPSSAANTPRISPSRCTALRAILRRTRVATSTRIAGSA